MHGYMQETSPPPPTLCLPVEVSLAVCCSKWHRLSSMDKSGQHCPARCWKARLAAILCLSHRATKSEWRQRVSISSFVNWAAAELMADCLVLDHLQETSSLGCSDEPTGESTGKMVAA